MNDNRMKHVAVIGAFDRHNYGDLLFPIIVRHGLSGFLETQNFALKKSDLSEYGAFTTEPMQCITEKSSSVIVSGGDVLCPDWLIMHLSHTRQSTITSFFLKGINKLLKNHHENMLYSFVEKMIQKYYGSCSILPWVPKPQDNTIRIVYNTVGGSIVKKLNLQQKKYLVESLQQSAYLSVRDSQVKRDLKEMGVERTIELFPDSATLMSEIFSKDKLLHSSPTEIQKFITSTEFIVFQVSFTAGKKNFNTIIEQLKSFFQTTNIPILLLPIGTATLHEDDVILERINTELLDETRYFGTQDIQTTMCLIAQAKLFLGSSLHGCITAMSYAVPYVGLSSEVSKIKAYLDSWAIAELKNGARPDTMAEEAVKAMEIDSEKLRLSRENLIQLSYENITAIKHALMG